jgi:hypothetical protein
MRLFFPTTVALLLSACAGGADEVGPGDDPAVGTRPAGEPDLVTVEGRLEEGVECLTLRTPDGEVWAVSMGEADFGPGAYVRITGEVADASFCMQGQGTLLPQSISEITPPARDRDPARAGGIALSETYVTGSWVAKGVDADCGDPDFTIDPSPGGIILRGDIEGHDNDAMVVLGEYPRLDLDEPRQDLPLESRGPDGLAILRPATDADYDPLTIGSATITGDGVVFVKCA